MHLFLFPRGMGKENVAVHKKCLQGNNDAIFGWLVGDLFGIWLVWGWFGLFVGGLAGLCLFCGWFDWFVGTLAGLRVVWLVCGWFWVLQLTVWNYLAVHLYFIKYLKSFWLIIYSHTWFGWEIPSIFQKCLKNCGLHFSWTFDNMEFFRFSWRLIQHPWFSNFINPFFCHISCRRHF